jgi:hypothetical protein
MKMTEGKCSCKGMVAAGLCLGIAGFAAYSMASGMAFFAPAGGTVQMQPSHDPLQSGVRIEESHRKEITRVTRPDADPTVVLLDKLTYTDGNPNTGGSGGGCGGGQPEGDEGTEPSVP